MPASNRLPSSGSSLSEMDPSGPVQFTASAKLTGFGIVHSAPLDGDGQHPCSLATSSVTRPGDDLQPPFWTSRLIRPATSGAMRWRWTSHHGRAWRRKRRCSASVSACHSGGCRAASCRPRPASRPARSALLSHRHSCLSEPCGTSSSATGAGSWSAWARGASPRRDRAQIRPAMPRLVQAQHHVDHGEAGADQQHFAAAGRGALDRRTARVAPRVVDEQCSGDALAQRRRLRRLVAMGERPAPGP